MEKLKIFQKDGKGERGGGLEIYIPKYLKYQDQLRALPWQGITMMLMTGLTLGIYTVLPRTPLNW